MATSTKQARRDISTQSNYDQFRIKHIRTDFTLDFTKQRLIGEVQLVFQVLEKGNEIVLDTSFLDLKKVKVNRAIAKWSLDPWAGSLGSALRIQLGNDVEVGKDIEVAICLSTTEQGTALQWLKSQQTSNKKHPYVFSQCQAIHARSVFPCQDTPDVKSTFEFRIRSPLPVITSGNATGTRDFEAGSHGQPGTLLYTFRQDVPIPSYLFAIASGDIATAAIGPRSLVATGPEELCAAKWEFEADTESFITVAERITQVPYAWGSYNVLVLPPSFPCGGMENPVFTFAMPSLISGDRELLSVIAHELAHSWSGNLVSNASWKDFWLNEGWTRYLERRILAAIHGEPYLSFYAIIGWKELVESVEQLGDQHEFTKLVPEIREDQDPDDAWSRVPYEKGFALVFHLENLVGREHFDQFIVHYFSTFARCSIDSEEFKTCVLEFFDSKGEDVARKVHHVDWDAWYYQPGLPPKPDFDTTLVDECHALADKWLARGQKQARFDPDPRDIAHFRAQQLVVFLDYIEDHSDQLSSSEVQLMGDVYGLACSQNIEVLRRWLALGLQRGARGAVLDRTVEVLGSTGRIYYVQPLFKWLAKADRELAIKTLEANKDFYHSTCWNVIASYLFGSG